MAKKAPNPIDKHVGSRVRMRRMMLWMSQEKLGDALGLTFQQVQKYEKGTNRIGASRLQQISGILQVPVAFFFEGAPDVPGTRPQGLMEAPSPAYVSDFLATSDGLALTKAFMRIPDAKLRRRIVDLVEQIAGERRTVRRVAQAGDRALATRRTMRPLPTNAHILTAVRDTARNTPHQDGAVESRVCGEIISVARKLSVHEQIGFRGSSRQGLRSHLRRGGRCVSSTRRTASAWTRATSASPARRCAPPTAS